MPKKRNENETWGENEAWGDDEGWDYKPPQPDSRSRNAAQRRDYAERQARPSAERPRTSARPTSERPAVRTRRPDGTRPNGERGARYRDDPRGRKPARKSKIVYFYIATLLLAVAVCLVLFAYMFDLITSQNNKIIPGITSPTEQPVATNPATVLDPRNLRSFFGLVTEVQTSPNKFTVLNIETNRDLSYEIVGTVNIENRFGNAMAYNELRAGMILEIGYDAQTSELVSLTESPKAWELKNKSNVKIDVATSSITLGNEKYLYNNETLVLYKGEPYLISRISSVDTVSLTGYGNDVWCVQLESSHGFLKIENTDKVINGNVTVDRSIIKPLAEVIEPLLLEEGIHTVIIEGDNIKTYTQSVTIKTGETTSLSLLDAELKPGLLQVTSSEPDSEIIIDGVAVSGPGPWEVQFGEHIVRVEKDGFLPVEQSVSVNQAVTPLHVVLSKILLNATLYVSTIPSPAEIYLDGVFIGNSPVTHETTVGPHSITARLTGYNDAFIPNYEIVEGTNSRALILQPTSNDPLAHTTPPPGGEPIIDQPYPTPTFDPYNPNTPTPWNEQPILPVPTPTPLPMPTPPPTPLPGTNPIFEEGTPTPMPTHEVIPPW